MFLIRTALLPSPSSFLRGSFLRVMCLFFPAVLLGGGTGFGQPLDLREIERIAVERNLNLQAQALETQAVEALISRGYGIYDPVLGAELAIGKNRERLNLQFFSAATKADYRRANISLLQRLPSGADIQVFFENQRQDIDPSPAINPYYDNVAGISLIQPLLRDFGRSLTERDILFAVRDRNISLQDLRERAFGVVTQVRDAYFNVLALRDEMAFRRTSVDLAERVLDENRARVKAGVLAPVEILEAQVGSKLRERELLDSQRSYEDALDELTLLLNLPETVQVEEAELRPFPVELSLEEGVSTAFRIRPDLLRRLEQIERLRLELRIAHNQLLPSLDLNAVVSHSGLGGNYGDALDDQVDDEFRSWEVGVLFSYPIGNRGARNELLRTRLRVRQVETLLAQLQDEIRQEIRSAIRLIESNGQQIEVTRLGTELARERLRTLLKRKEVGLSTTRDVLEGEEDLAESQTLLIAALADYNRAVTEYLRATGQLLDREGIRFTHMYDSSGAGSMLGMEKK